MEARELADIPGRVFREAGQTVDRVGHPSGELAQPPGVVGRLRGESGKTIDVVEPLHPGPGRASGVRLRVLGEPGNRVENAGRLPGEPGDWDDAVRAISYRVIVSNTANPPVELKNDIIHGQSEATYADLPPGTAIKVTVASRNSKGGEWSAREALRHRREARMGEHADV